MNTKKLIDTILIICYFVVVSSETAEEADGFVVQLPQGKIRGRSRNSAKGIDFYSFQDIPYAAPPIGKNRFQVPKPHEGWNGILDTTDNKKICIGGLQPYIPPNESTDLKETQSEDCLYLNVYTPVKPGSNNSLPVYVFIHGGAFRIGNGAYSSYCPNYLMDYDIIVVTMNYRLGPFGFLSTEDGVIPGNLGLRDQSFAMKWVQENIQLFGGNPKKVTLGGESAGAVSTGYHLLSHQSKGLFSSIILQSGTAINTWGLQTNPDGYAFQLGNILDKSLGSTNSSKLLSVLMKASATAIFSASFMVHDEENILGISIRDMIWAPTIEDKNLQDTFISEAMYDSLEKGKFNQVPILIGFTDEESLTFYEGIIANVVARTFDKDTSLLVNDKFHLDVHSKSIVGNELWKLCTKNTSFRKNMSALVMFTSDNFMTRSSIRHAEITSRYVPTYFYQFSYAADKNKRFPDAGNTGHAQEMRFIWKSGSADIRDFDSIMRERTLKLWTNFMKYHDPTPTPDSSLMNTVWPKVQPGTITYLNIDRNFSIATNPRRYNEVKSILDEYVRSPLATY